MQKKNVFLSFYFYFLQNKLDTYQKCMNHAKNEFKVFMLIKKIYLLFNELAMNNILCFFHKEKLTLKKEIFFIF